MLKITPRKMIKCCIYMADDPYYQKTYLCCTVRSIIYNHVHFQICDSF